MRFWRPDVRFDPWKPGRSANDKPISILSFHPTSEIPCFYHVSHNSFIWKVAMNTGTVSDPAGCFSHVHCYFRITCPPFCCAMCIMLLAPAVRFLGCLTCNLLQSRSFLQSQRHTLCKNLWLNYTTSKEKSSEEKPGKKHLSNGFNVS